MSVKSTLQLELDVISQKRHLNFLMLAKANGAARSVLRFVSNAIPAT